MLDFLFKMLTKAAGKDPVFGQSNLRGETLDGMGVVVSMACPWK